MRFHQLSVGQRFRSDGVNYIKTSPMIASDAKTGWQKFMARSTLVELNDQPAASSRLPQDKLNPEAVYGALQHYHLRCIECLEGAAVAVAPETLQTMKQGLEAARRSCLDTLFRD